MKKSKILSWESVLDLIIMFLALPICLFFVIQHAAESVAMISSNFKDKLFMRRFNLIDEEHVQDLIKWNRDYCTRRAVARKRGQAQVIPRITVSGKDKSTIYTLAKGAIQLSGVYLDIAEDVEDVTFAEGIIEDARKTLKILEASKES